MVEADGPVTFTELIAEATGLAKSTTSRLLGALERHGLVQRDRDGRFVPARCSSGSPAAASADDRLVAVARPFLERLGRPPARRSTSASPGAGAVEQIAQVDRPT